jgi:hypothetical protein
LTDPYVRPGKILSTYGHLYPDAGKRVDEFRAKQKELGDVTTGLVDGERQTGK